MGEKFMILGFDRKQGEFQGQPYDNYMFYCQPLAKEAVAGIPVETVKVRRNVVISCLDRDPVPGDVGCVLLVAWDRYGKPGSISIEEGK